VSRRASPPRTRSRRVGTPRAAAPRRTGQPAGVAAHPVAAAPRRAPRTPGDAATLDLLFEIGVEELPAGYVPPALEQLERGAGAMLADLRLACGEIRAFGTPRRLVLHVRDLAVRQTDFSEEVQGPAVRVAYDAAGSPTRALLGFCAGRGVELSAVRRVATPKGEYVAVTVHHAGKPALEVLPSALATLAQRLSFPKTMRWLADETRFARPVRWLVALLGDEIVPVRAFGLEAGRGSQGHRFLAPGAVEIETAGGYLDTLRRAVVCVDHRERRQSLEDQLDRLADTVHGAVRSDDDLIEMNVFMTEWPIAFLGEFDERFHELPNEVVITGLREHQRFFAVQAGTGDFGDQVLHNKFIAVRDGDGVGLEAVRKGNEAVLKARLEDALFYWHTDLKKKPADRVEALGRVVWIEGLGTLRDKAARLESLCEWLAARLAPDAAAHAKRAALLCKTDLLSEMIGSGKEYAALQGIIGGYYAARAGEPEEVAKAIYWHYHPRFASDVLPKTETALLLSLADKLDHVAGAFAAGKAPSGSEDPYGVRRSANGVLRILIEKELHLDLRDATMEITRPFFTANSDLPQAEIVKSLGDFWRSRVWSIVGGGEEERGEAFHPDTVEAAMEARVNGRPGWTDPFDCLLRTRVLNSFRGDARFEPLVILFKRVGNILKAATETLPESLDRARLTEAAEHELLSALESARGRTAPLWREREYGNILPALLEMEHAIHGFFDRVMVNVDDLPTRVNRLRLLTEVRELFVRGWDLSRVVVEGEKGA